MHRSLSILFILLCAAGLLDAQVFPQEGSVLNYRLIGFSFPPASQAKNYTIEIAAGNFNTEMLFTKKIIASVSAGTNKMIAKVPAFNSQYTWRVTYQAQNGATVKQNILHHFTTGSIPAVDTTVNRLRITTPVAQDYKDAYIFIDAIGVLYDMSGQPVWYKPELSGENDNMQPRDLKLSPFGTITFLNGPRIYEINYNGNILWQKPGNTNLPEGFNINEEPYHHEFTRLTNGHYMALKSQSVLCKLPTENDTTFRIINDDKIRSSADTVYKNLSFGDLVEYNEKGDIIWQWRSSLYAMSSDLRYLYTSPGNITSLHDNSFYFDEINKIIYISFKNINRIIKIKYPEGEVLNTYGKIYNNNAPRNFHDNVDLGNDEDLFCVQHACKCDQEGYLYLYNNGCDPDGPSSVVMLKQPLTKDGQPRITWEYECGNPHIQVPLSQKAGGNVIELPHKAMFISMGMQYGEVFIVSHDKKIQWGASPETFDPIQKSWHPKPSYRASIITNHKDIEQLIWNAQK